MFVGTKKKKKEIIIINNKTRSRPFSLNTPRSNVQDYGKNNIKIDQLELSQKRSNSFLSK